MFNIKMHNNDLYNTLLSLSRNIFFYKEIKLPDTFETRIYLMFTFLINDDSLKKKILNLIRNHTIIYFKVSNII